MKKSISICLLLLAVLTLGGCNQEDDINEIFVSGQYVESRAIPIQTPTGTATMTETPVPN